MTVEEQLEQLKKDKEQIEAELDKVKKNESKQNSYITQLEAEKKQAEKQAKDLADQVAKNPQPKGSNKAYENYMRDKWRSEVTDKALTSLKNTYPKEHVDALRDDVVAYCKKNMKDDTTTEKYAKKVFAMLYGEALGDPKHPINQSEKDPKKKTEPEPEPEPTPESPQRKPGTVTPPTMNSGDPSVVPGQPASGGKEPKDTRESLTSLRERLGNVNNTTSE